MPHAMVPIGKLDPNPHRDMESYPLSQSKIDTLTKSYEQTGYWGNLLAREVGGRYQIAYGHHRREALRRRYDLEAEVPIIVVPMNDMQMMQIMARENLPDWFGGNTTTTMETVKSLVNAFSEGVLELPPTGKNVNKRMTRYAPSFIRGRSDLGNPDCPYSSAQLGKVLGESFADDAYDDAYRHIRCAVAALETVELGLCVVADYDGLNPNQCRLLSSEMIKKYDETMEGEEADDAPEETIEKLKTDSEALRDSLRNKESRVTVEYHEDDPEGLAMAAGRLSMHAINFLTKDYLVDASYVIKYPTSIPEGNSQQLRDRLEAAVGRAQDVLTALKKRKKGG